MTNSENGKWHRKELANKKPLKPSSGRSSRGGCGCGAGGRRMIATICNMETVLIHTTTSTTSTTRTTSSRLIIVYDMVSHWPTIRLHREKRCCNPVG
ncbi:uncharacterized protein Dsimw501_GD28675, isoform H [Drosophila simulans]|nr:uncharacterized protein Dsimw501_GD28675, isoform A [Drosophila simulans]KMZ08223.1 uncharacterized protein Dsimw501_GD28675, isoform B [Drosophila simulans]KMZ08224.1 uncharacterized protein Dsimw501_GD28675, isoform C [Drosophila simulans]KMZ08225.1 uncharacterized protein Dsimw501_GD28675, isoform D [Drosophila simulans]KMZ08226.1 uncharacterized protein Dsimw501_GD28675, isoform E [Drosophila simulans]